MTPITIVTPTWNRRALLDRLFASLAVQSVPQGSFVWMVVDDGSTDGTPAHVRTLARTARFPVQLVVERHGGKHRALNRGVPGVATPWMLVLDSDDWILPGGLAHALAKIAAHDGDAATEAIVSPRVFADRAPPVYPAAPGPIDYATWRTKYFRSDFSMLVRTGAMRRHPFPEFEGEDFVAESAVYARAFAGGGIRLSNARVMGAEYQKLGLTEKMLQNRVACPRGATYTYRAQLASGLRGGPRLRAMLNYHRFWWHARALGRPPGAPLPPGGAIWRPAGWLLYRRDRRILG